VYNESAGGIKSKWYEVDDVAVWGSSESQPLDLEMTEIIRPHDREEGETAFNPSCKVYNNLESTVYAEVVCHIEDFSGKYTEPGIVYEHVIVDYSLEPGYNTIEFDEFIPQSDTTYNAYFEVTHPDDADESNNNLDKNFTTCVNEVNPYEMVSPSSSRQKVPFDPAAWYTECSEETSENVTLHCEITDVVSEDKVYSYALDPRKFDPFDSVLAVFDEAWLADGKYEIKFWATDENGVNVSDPPLIDTFFYLGIFEEPVLESELDLAVNSPCVGSVVIRFSSTRPSRVNLEVFNVTGRVEKSLVSGFYQPGIHTVEWEPDVSGVYFVKFTTPDLTETRKLVVIK
jgi:hypothetical protein